MVQQGDAKEVTTGDDGELRMHGQICVPNVDGLRELIIEEAIVRGRMKKDIVGFVAQCLNLGWFEPGEARLLGTNLGQEALDKVNLILDRLCMVQSRQKSYADQKVRDVAYMVGKRVLLKVSPMKGVMRFGKKVKLSPRYIGPFDVLHRIGEVAYKVALPPSLSSVHLMFHVSMLQKYVGDPSHVLDFSTIQLDGDLIYDVELVAILGRQVSKLEVKGHSFREGAVERSTS
ncbi:uncharacterized protein [Nicotiana tomentosiformis]|uniref:uncharacterized protein n=1 Tax=Nicotiana tomentosiformis TaxID=4098 RepID=UPI00388C6954